MAEFEDTTILDFRPKLEKNKETGEQFAKMIFKGELNVGNSQQINDLFGSFRKQLIKVNFSSYEDLKEIVFNDVHLDDFEVGTKMERIGKGRDIERIPVEKVRFTMSVRIDEEGNILRDIFSIFRKTVKMQLTDIS